MNKEGLHVGERGGGGGAESLSLFSTLHALVCLAASTCKRALDLLECLLSTSPGG